MAVVAAGSEIDVVEEEMHGKGRHRMGWPDRKLSGHMKSTDIKTLWKRVSLPAARTGLSTTHWHPEPKAPPILAVEFSA